MHYTHKLEAITQLKDLPRSLSGTPRESHTHSHIMKHRPVVRCRRWAGHSAHTLFGLSRCKGAGPTRLCPTVDRGRARWTPTVHSQTRPSERPTSTTQSQVAPSAHSHSNASRCVRLSRSNADAAGSLQLRAACAQSSPNKSHKEQLVLLRTIDIDVFGPGAVIGRSVRGAGAPMHGIGPFAKPDLRWRLSRLARVPFSFKVV